MDAWKRFAAVAMGAMLSAGCLQGSDTSGSGDAPGPGRVAQGDGACVTYSGSGEVSARGRLVQLDVAFRYAGSRSGELSAQDVHMRLDAEAVVEASSSQLACAWDQVDGSPVVYDLRRGDGDGRVRFPVQAQGTARLAGTRVLQDANSRGEERVDVSGPVEVLEVMQIGRRNEGDRDVCVIVSFDAPLHGSSIRTITAPGIRRQEEVAPSALVSDGYSMLSPRSFGDGDHRFLNQSFAICTGQDGGQGPPRGLSISPDGLLWTRSGAWTGHASGPNERRTVDFTLRVVPPTLALD